MRWWRLSAGPCGHADGVDPLAFASRAIGNRLALATLTLAIRGDRLALATLALAIAVTTTSPAAAADGTFLGVAACSSGMCHGSIVARIGSHVAQNEYTIWSRRDAHARAYQTLSNERARQIAQRLGLASAESAAECTGCHALNVAPERRGPKFQISDGVSCEGCHGAAGSWIETHEDAGRTHAENVKAGMRELDNPQVRAATCMPCHQGSGDRAVTHRLMAAGHPRLSFELDTFTYLEPPHFRVDDDYRARKMAPDSATVWATGQAASVATYMDLLSRPRSSHEGIWPEFSLFDCFGCHHDIGTLPASTGTGLGRPHPGNSSVTLYRELTEQLAPARSGELDHELAGLDSSVADRKQLATACTGLADAARTDAQKLAHTSLDGKQIETLIARLTSSESATRYRTYADAEQVTMAVQALLATLNDRGALAGPRAARLQSALDSLFDATRNEQTFRAASFAQALGKLRAAL